MNIKRRMSTYITIFLAVFVILTYVSRESNNYISITTNRESKDIFNKNNEEGLKKVPIFRYLNDYINVNSKPGEYLIEVQENSYLEENISVIKSEGKSLKVALDYIPKSDLRKNNIFLNVLTGTFLLFNLRLLYNFKKEIIRKKGIIFPIILLCLKILLTNSELFSNVVLTRINLLITSILGLYLLLYVKNKSYQIKNDKLINIFLWMLFIIYYIGEVVMSSAVLNSKILNYLAINYSSFLKLSIFFYVWVDALIIIFIMFLLESIKIKKKQIIKEIEKKNLAMIGSFIILSLAVEFFINNNKYFYYLNMFEFVYIFWYIFLTDINTVGKVKVINLKIFQMFLHTYLFFVITENVWIALGVIFSFYILNLWTYFITGALRVNKHYIDNLINRMYLTKNSEEFKEQLFIGLILIANRGTKLVYEEKRYLEEISKQISLIVSKYRFEKLQEELN